MSFKIEILPGAKDTYTYLVGDHDLGLAMVVDPGEGELVSRALRERDFYLALVLNTHHHPDHTGGNEKLQHEFGAPVIGPFKEKGLISCLSRSVDGGDVVTFSTLRGQVLATYGHTDGHVAYYFPQIKALFSGDALFSLGCGRLVEGNTNQMWESLKSLRTLPDDTQIYFGHEYSEENAKFALAIDKNNAALKTRAAEIAALRKAGKPTAPTLLGVEKQCNPFLRTDQAEFRKILAAAHVAPEDADPAAVFGKLRTAKDHFGQQKI